MSSMFFAYSNNFSLSHVVATTVVQVSLVIYLFDQSEEALQVVYFSANIIAGDIK